MMNTTKYFIIVIICLIGGGCDESESAGRFESEPCEPGESDIFTEIEPDPACAQTCLDYGWDESLTVCSGWVETFPGTYKSMTQCHCLYFEGQQCDVVCDTELCGVNTKSGNACYSIE